METAINYILLLLTIDINIPFEKKVFEYSRYVGFAVMESTVGTHRSTEHMFCFQQLFVNLNQKGFWVLVSLLEREENKISFPIFGWVALFDWEKRFGVRI